MRYAFIAAALVGAVAAVPAVAPPAYGGSEEGPSTTDVTSYVTITSCGAEVTNCPATQVPATYPTTTADSSFPPEMTPSSPAAPPAETPYSPGQGCEGEACGSWPHGGGEGSGHGGMGSGHGGEGAPPAYPSAPASAPVTSLPPPAETSPASPTGGEGCEGEGCGSWATPSAPASAPVESIPPPAETSPASPVGGEAPPAYPSAPAAPPAESSPASPVGGEAPYPVPSGPAGGSWGGYPAGNGSYPAPSGTASMAPSASMGYPAQQTGNTAAGIKAAGLLSGAGALAALLL